MSVKFLLLGGGVFWVLGGGGKCRFYFYGREDFSDKNQGRGEGRSKDQSHQDLRNSGQNLVVQGRANHEVQTVN